MSRPITLSFDNGPWPGVTEKVLDVLGRRGLRTTFFVVGRHLRDPDRRALAQRAHAEGHWIGNHTMTHSVQLGAGAGADAPREEIGAAQELIGDLSHPDRFFRPYGAGGVLGPDLLSSAAVEFLQDGAFTCVLWSSVPHDWERDVDWVERCLSDAREQDWPLVVLHDLPGCAVGRLEEFLDRLSGEGFAVQQELPAHCVPIRRGTLERSLDGLTKGV